MTKWISGKKKDDMTPLMAVTNILLSNSFTIPTFTHTWPTLPPSLLSPYIVDVHLGPLQKEREEEREREETKEGERGTGVSGDNSPPSPSPLLSGLCRDLYDLWNLHVSAILTLIITVYLSGSILESPYFALLSNRPIYWTNKLIVK